MDDLAPDIVRQRLLIEGYYDADLSAEDVKQFLVALADALDLRHYSEPTIHAPEGIGKDGNEGFDAFLPLIDSGISLYVWTANKFFACVIFTCKTFDAEAAIAFTRQALQSAKLVFREF